MIPCPEAIRDETMASAHGLDLRRRVIEAIDAGMSARAAAARFSVGASTAINWRWREAGRLEAGRQGKPRRSKLDPHEAFILDLAVEPRLAPAQNVRLVLLAGVRGLFRV
jgi:transposase